MPDDKRKRDISELDDDAQYLRVTWKKMNNFLRSFALRYFQVKEQFNADEFAAEIRNGLTYEWDFRFWLGRKAGVMESTVLDMLKVREQTLADEEREKRNLAEKELKTERREAREATKRAAAQRKADRQAATAAPADTVSEPVTPEPEPIIEPVKPQPKPRPRRVIPVDKPRHPDTVIAGYIEGSEACLREGRIGAGAYYAKLRACVRDGKAGRNPVTGKLWSFGGFIAAYIPRSRQDVYRCIDEFEAAERVRSGEPAAAAEASQTVH